MRSFFCSRVPLCKKLPGSEDLANFALPKNEPERMANHRSTLRRIRSDHRKRERNNYYHKTARTFIKRLRNTKDKKEAEERLPKVTSMIDRLVRRNVIHKNKAANLKASLQKHVNELS